MSAQVIWSNVSPTAGTAGQTITATGNSGPISLIGPSQALAPFAAPVPVNWQNFWISLVTGTPTGTTPTLALTITALDAWGNSLGNLVTLPAGFSLTTVAGNAQASFGVNFASTLQVVAPVACQITWTVGGTTPSYGGTFISLVGR